jgi:hypothetical protein
VTTPGHSTVPPRRQRGHYLAGDMGCGLRSGTRCTALRAPRASRARPMRCTLTGRPRRRRRGAVPGGHRHAAAGGTEPAPRAPGPGADGFSVTTPRIGQHPWPSGPDRKPVAAGTAPGPGSRAPANPDIRRINPCGETTSYPGQGRERTVACQTMAALGRPRPSRTRPKPEARRGLSGTRRRGRDAAGEGALGRGRDVAAGGHWAGAGTLRPAGTGPEPGRCGRRALGRSRDVAAGGHWAGAGTLRPASAGRVPGSAVGG